MTKQDDREKAKIAFRDSLIMLAFGVGTLAFLVAIDRPEWFTLRPVSGTAAAMSNAAHVSNVEERAEREEIAKKAREHVEDATDSWF